MKRTHDEFEKLVSGYLDENLGEAEMSELTRSLTEDPAKADLFAERAMLEAHLLRHGEMAAAMDGRERDRVWGHGNRSALVKSVLAAAAVLVLGAVLLYLIQVPEPEPYAEWRMSPHATVLVSGQDGDVEEGTLEKGATLSVRQGTAEIQLEEGVRCLVQAPGRILLSDTGRVNLLEGVARFQVQEQAKGFRVVTSSLQVVDLGTDFGVDLTVPDQPQVHVIEGEVEVRSLTGRKEQTRLRGGHAMALGAVGALQSVPLDARRFPGELPKGIPAVRFSFDELRGDMVHATGELAEQAGAHLLLNHDKAPALAEGRFGQALRFGRGRGYAETNWMGIGGSQARTISLWIRTDMEDPKDPMMILGWGTWSGIDLRMSNMGLRLSGGRNDGRLRVESGRRWLEGVTRLNDGKWHHVLVCMGEYSRRDWPETRVFIDGREEDLAPRLPLDQRFGPLDTFSTDVTGYGATPLILGQMAAPGTIWPMLSFQGDIDEVIIAAGVLSEAQVQALYEGRLEDSGLDLGLDDVD